MSNDTLIANAGDDTLDGGQGNDVLMGGVSNDTYFFNRSVESTGQDIVERHQHSWQRRTKHSHPHQAQP
ncbi:MAG: hypothetical protein U1E99_05875 [Agitococcus sp.]